MISLRKEFSKQFNKAVASFCLYAKDKLAPHRDETVIISPSVKALQDLVEAYTHPIRIERLLVNIQQITNYL